MGLLQSVIIALIGGAVGLVTATQEFTKAGRYSRRIERLKKAREELPARSRAKRDIDAAIEAIAAEMARISTPLGVDGQRRYHRLGITRLRRFVAGAAGALGAALLGSGVTLMITSGDYLFNFVEEAGAPGDTAELTELGATTVDVIWFGSYVLLLLLVMKFSYELLAWQRRRYAAQAGFDVQYGDDRLAGYAHLPRQRRTPRNALRPRRTGLLDGGR